ncbi:MAG: SAM-dependent methyltransferase, MidA family [Chloroflexi bacterium]|jgi:SAM-dependent MidA family methyltransferase|nr:MAG: SAM-dependent methyltransferase, MidA family [Chloroflexota bacterium]
MVIPHNNQPAGEAEALVRQAIASDGHITFARFMELAQLAPGVGYFRHRNPTGSQGDYFTSPLTHPAFGALLGLQMRQVWQLLGSPSKFSVVEMGAGRGTLGDDVLAFAERFDPDFHKALNYVAAEASPSGSFGAQQWVETINVPFRNVTGAFVANELIDALPVHRFQIEGGKLREVYVTVENGDLADDLGDPSTPELERYLLEQDVRLAEGFRGEVCLAGEYWLADVAEALDQGIVLLVDYGHLAKDLYSPERKDGTLRTYFRHTLGSDPYRRVGRQDITTHVNFSHLMRTGERLGLTPVGFADQRTVLSNLGIEAFAGRLSRMGIPRGEGEAEANRYAMQELVKSDGMGNFKVLALAKDIPAANLHGFTPENPLIEELSRHANLPVPLLGPAHMPLRQDSIPNGEQEFTLESLW